MKLRPARAARGAREDISDLQARVYTLAMTLLYGAFTPYLGSAEIIGLYH